MIIAVEVSKNAKTGPCSNLYAPLSTCPDTCPFKARGCYARNGKTYMHARRCTESEAQYTQLETAQHEADKIRSLSGKLPLRLHVSGDFFDAQCAAIIDSAAGEYTAKHGQAVWAYTHNWRVIPRETFKNISILASVENMKDATEAKKAGYAVAIVIPEGTKSDSVTICPHITRGTPCVSCKLCLHADKLKKPIAFYPHGAQRKSVEAVIKK
jgi:hypothetical protein